MSQQAPLADAQPPLQRRKVSQIDAVVFAAFERDSSRAFAHLIPAKACSSGGQTQVVPTQASTRPERPATVANRQRTGKVSQAETVFPAPEAQLSEDGEEPNTHDMPKAPYCFGFSSEDEIVPSEQNELPSWIRWSKLSRKANSGLTTSSIQSPRMDMSFFTANISDIPKSLQANIKPVSPRKSRTEKKSDNKSLGSPRTSPKRRGRKRKLADPVPEESKNITNSSQERAREEDSNVSPRKEAGDENAVIPPRKELRKSTYALRRKAEHIDALQKNDSDEEADAPQKRESKKEPRKATGVLQSTASSKKDVNSRQWEEVDQDIEESLSEMSKKDTEIGQKDVKALQNKETEEDSESSQEKEKKKDVEAPSQRKEPDEDSVALHREEPNNAANTCQGTTSSSQQIILDSLGSHGSAKECKRTCTQHCFCEALQTYISEGARDGIKRGLCKFAQEICEITIRFQLPSNRDK